MNDRVAVLSVAHEAAFGAEHVLATLVEGLPREFTHRCLLLRPEASRLARWTAGVAIPSRRWGAGRDTMWRNLLASLRAARELRAERVGLVHAWGVRAFEPAVLLAHLLGARITGTLHDHPRASFLTRPREILLRASARRLRPLVCVSEALAAACRNTGLDGDLAVIRNGLAALPSAASQRDRSRDTAIRVGFFGLYARWKGFETVRAWIEQAGPEIEWHLYGEPAPEIRAPCAEVQAKQLSNVVFHGWVDGAGSMDGIDVLLHASIGFDPFPTVLLEAARAGIPAVATNVGGAAEIVVDRVTGFLFTPGDPTGLGHLRRLASNAALRTTMGVAARRRFEMEFGVRQMVESYMNLWNSRLGSSLSERG